MYWLWPHYGGLVDKNPVENLLRDPDRLITFILGQERLG